LDSAGLTAGRADQDLFAVFVVLPLLALLGAVVVSRLLVVWVVLAGWGLPSAVSSSCHGWLVAGRRHGAPSDCGTVLAGAVRQRGVPHPRAVALGPTRRRPEIVGGGVEALGDARVSRPIVGPFELG